MQSIPTIAFLAAIAFFLIGAFLILYHLIRFGVGSEPKLAAFVFFAGSAVFLLAATVFYFNAI